jgi:hypothetical protein
VANADATESGGATANGEARANVDRALVVGATPDGETLAILRSRGDGTPIEAAIARTPKDGEPLTGELVRLRPRGEVPALCDVEVLYDGRRPPSNTPEPARKGPPRVSSVAYREGWERVFAAGSGSGGELPS